MRTSLTRRRFLQLLGTASAGIVIPGCGSSDGHKQSDALGPVIVVGAGISGLTVANAMATAGVEVVVLEARDRIGGRTWTADIGGVRVDLGGAWIHGPDGNPIACFAAANDIGWRLAETVDATLSGYDPHAGFISGPELLRFLEVQLQFEDAIDELVSSLGPNASLNSGTTLFLDQKGFTGDDRRYADFAIRQGIGELFYGGPADITSLAALFDDLELGGGNHFPNGGYIEVVNALATGLDVRLNEAVASIRYDSRGVVVSTGTQMLRGSHVVVTVPLGVLKAQRIEFDPPLPAEKRGAIERLDMGNLEKVVLRFDRAFWHDARRRNFIYLSDTYGEFPFFFDYTPFAGTPTLVGLYSGGFARQAAARSDDDMRARVTAILGEVFAIEPPAPTHFMRTRWTADSLSYGSYSYVPVGGNLDDMNLLAAPIGDRLLFAGEATVPEYYGTVHAAFISGVREAKRLLQSNTVELSSGPAPEVGCT